MVELTDRERQALSLGATMYVPGTHPDLISIACEHKTQARSLVICTEDAVEEDRVEFALGNIQAALPTLMNLEQDGVQVFIRPRTPEVLRRLLNDDNIRRCSGFVLPKFSLQTIEAWSDALEGAPPMLGVMPTLETACVFDLEAMRMLSVLLRKGSLSSRVIALRIGGNDLFNCLGLRRPRNLTIYDTPLGLTIANLVSIFRPQGFMLSAPVFEHFKDTETMRRELILDKAYGLIGKTAIHPEQLSLIEEMLAPTEMELEEANAILEEGAPAVFSLNGSMCEPATHHRWARMIRFVKERQHHPKLRNVA